jgi:hypothetical protein
MVYFYTIQVANEMAIDIIYYCLTEPIGLPFLVKLRIPQAAPVQQTTIGTAGAACGIRKRHKRVLTEGLGTAFPQKGVPKADYHV